MTYLKIVTVVALSVAAIALSACGKREESRSTASTSSTHGYSK